MQRMNLGAIAPLLAGATLLAFFHFVIGYSWQASILRGGVVMCATFVVVAIRRASQNN